MEVLNQMVAMLSHFIFIAISYQLLATVIDWSKFVKLTDENIPKLRMLVLFMSIGLGFLVSHMVLELIQISQSLFFMFQ